MGGLLHMVQRRRDFARPQSTVPNVTAHPRTATVPITVLLYNGPLLCGFNVRIKGLRRHVHRVVEQQTTDDFELATQRKGNSRIC